MGKLTKGPNPKRRELNFKTAGRQKSLITFLVPVEEEPTP